MTYFAKKVLMKFNFLIFIKIFVWISSEAIPLRSPHKSEEFERIFS